MLQPQEVTKSKRYAKDNLNISDIPGVKPDVYKRYRHLEGRNYLDTKDINGEKPAWHSKSQISRGPDYKLYTKDINPEKWRTKRVVNPLEPEYFISTKSGRSMTKIGQIEKSHPKNNVSPTTNQLANFIEFPESISILIS